MSCNLWVAHEAMHLKVSGCHRRPKIQERTLSGQLHGCEWDANDLPFYWKLDETGISSESSMVSVISGLEARLPKQDPPKTLSKYQHQHLT